MRPTRAWGEGDELFVRFNVMQGPGRRPLAPGRWLLSTDTASPVRLSASGSFDPAPHAGRFPFRRGEYRVMPGLAEDGTVLTFDVTVERLAPTPRAVPPLKRLFRRLVRRPLRKVARRGSALIYRAVRTLSRGGRILFIPYDRRTPSGSLRQVYDRMLERGLGRRLLLYRTPARAGRLGRRLNEVWMLGRADAIVVDKDHRLLRQVRLDVPVIQLWHASAAFKAVGHSRIGTGGGVSPWSRWYRVYTHAIASGVHDVPLWAEAFGVPEERVVPTGIPRMDRFFDPARREAGREAVGRTFPQSRGRRVILFAPTFRGRVSDGRYDLGQLDFAVLHELCREKDAVFIIRLHPAVRHPVEIPEAFRDRILDGTGRLKGEIPDLLFATDLLITDYSSIMFDYATQGRPMLFFAPDLEDYRAHRGLAVDYEAYVPGRIVRTFDEMVDAIRRDDYQVERLAPFIARHFAHLDGGSTDRVVDLILSQPR
jgi:CDP-ribitol ribitolphosphotransferase